jgi:photosystem II stability/assembly factor-like uncharacterized protein
VNMHRAAAACFTVIVDRRDERACHWRVDEYQYESRESATAARGWIIGVSGAVVRSANGGREEHRCDCNHRKTDPKKVFLSEHHGYLLSGTRP